MKFIIQNNEEKKNFDLIYRSDEYSFDIDPHEGYGFTSILINDLQLEVDDEGRIIYVWGYCPLIYFKETEEFPKEYTSSTLVVKLERPLIPGISHRLNQGERWPIYINQKNGWICIGNPKTKNQQMIEFIPNCIASMKDQEIIAIWLWPKII